MLGSGCAFGRFLAVAFIKAIDASRRVDQFLLAGKKRVAGGTDFDVQVAFLGGARFEGLAARATHGDFNVFWVYSWFHLTLRHSL